MNKLITLYFIVLVVFHNTSFGQGCVGNLVTNGDFNSGLTGWNIVSSSPPGYNGYAPCDDWHIVEYPTSEFYVYNNCDHATNAQINQTISGLVSGTLNIDFQVWANNFQPPQAHTTALLEVYFDGVKYAELFNNPASTSETVTITPFNGATANIASFPVPPTGNGYSLDRYNLVISFPYSGASSADLSYRFSTAFNEGDDFAIDKIKVCVGTHTVTGNNILLSPCNINPFVIQGSEPTISPSNSYTYQWQFSTNNGLSWTDISGANAKDYSTSTQGTYRRNVIVDGVIFSSNSIVANLLFASNCYNVSGNVFNDANAMVDNYVNGTGIGSASGVQLYANLVNNSGVVIKSVPISSDGTYSFSEVPGTATSTSFILYTIRISTIEGTLGSAPPVNTLPPDWINTGEKVGTTAGTDPTVDGILTVQVRNADVTNVNFGIEQLPDSDSYSIPIAQPTVDQYVTLNGGTNPPILSGSDPEDGTLGTGSKVRITTLPTNGKLWYGGSAVYANQIISNFNPSLLQMQFTGSGYTETSFTYAFLDAGNKQDLSPATYTLSWGTPLPVHFLSFTTNVTRVKTVSIELITVNEQNLSSYIIERKTNNGVWESIGYFTPKNLVTLNKYQFIDENPSTQNQYRIKAINVDNTFEYTNVNIVQISFEGKVNVFPNPASGVLNITDAKPNSYIQIVSLEGKIIIETQINNNNQAIDISTISKGIYWARLLYNKKEYFIDKLFVKR